MVPQDFGLNCPEYTMQRIDDYGDLPETLSRGVVFIIGNRGNEWLAALSCPCGCDSKLLLNIMDDVHPYWRWTVDKDQLITLSPSVNRLTGCKSHFFLVKGRVDWCGRPLSFQQ